MKISVSRHAIEKARNRLGISKNALTKLTKRAYEQGYSIDQLSGTLKQYIKAKQKLHKEKKNSEIRIYGEFVYIFSVMKEEVILVTVYQLPPRAKRQIKNIKETV